MESQSCPTPRGEGVISPDLESESPIRGASAVREVEPKSPVRGASAVNKSCQNVSAKGRHCRMLSQPGSALCEYHTQRQSRSVFATEVPYNDAIAAELLDSVDDFTSPEAVNLFLGNLTRQVVRRRVARGDAMVLAYLSQLLLNSLSAMNREQQQRDDEKKRRPPTIVWDGIFQVPTSGNVPSKELKQRLRRLPPPKKPAESPYAHEHLHSPSRNGNIMLPQTAQGPLRALTKI